MEEGEFCVNISSKQRETLLQNYRSVTEEKCESEMKVATDSVLQQDIELPLDMNDIAAETPESTGSVQNGDVMQVAMQTVASDSFHIAQRVPSILTEKELVRRYLEIFDEAMEAIISLIRHDSLPRFYDTKAYETMSQ